MVAKLVKLVRAIALSILFGGSAAIVFAAIVLVKTASANGVPVNVAAASNAPVFIHFSKVLFVAAMALLLSESINFALHRKIDKLRMARYATSLVCVAAAIIFTFAIVPPMAELLPLIKNSSGISTENREKLHASFTRLHEISRIVFGTTILFALFSTAIPIFECEAKNEQ